MFNVTYPELVYMYHRAERQMPRQVVEPSTGVWGHTTHQSFHQAERKVKNDGKDFHTFFSQAMERNAQ